MPILNFRKQFVDRILDGSKAHTIRCGKREIRKGQLLYCQHGPRFSPTRFAVLPALRVRRITLTECNAMIWHEDGDLFVVPPLDRFARSDGFNDWSELRSFFMARHGRIDRLGNEGFEIRGQLIQWIEAEWESEK